MNAWIAPDADAVDLTWQTTVTHSRRITREQFGDYLGPDGELTHDDLDAMAADCEGGDTYLHTDTRTITEVTGVTVADDETAPAGG